MNKDKTLTLSNGVKMPIIGFGVFQIPDLEQCEQAVFDALKTGYRLLDTAHVYGNEVAVGKGIKRSGVPRKEIFLTTKIWVKDFGYEKTKAAIDRALKKLDVDYIDLMLLHRPFSDVFGAWRALEEYYKAGKLKAIGVSNFPSGRLVDLKIYGEIPPMVNQIEMHPYLQRPVEAIEIQNEDVVLEAWAPFAEGRDGMFTNETLKSIGDKYNKSNAQVILRWFIQRDIVVIPKSVHLERIQQNFDVFDFELSDEDMKLISTIDRDEQLWDEQMLPETIKQMSKFNPAD
jgi:2,5-diketo-D-gluconate reductase A